MNKKAQIWVETVIYTLIGISILGILLAVSKPKIDSYKDRLVIEQTIDSLNEIDKKIYNSLIGGPGNTRMIDLKISKGRFVINSNDESIYWILDSNYEYSEPGVSVPWGKLDILTTGEKPWEVKISLKYTGVDLTFEGEDIMKELLKAPSPYTLTIQNKGETDSGNVKIDLRTS